MSQRVDTPVNTMHLSHGHPRSNRIFTDPTAAQLTDRDHPVLLLGDHRHRYAGWPGDFPVHFTGKSPGVDVLPSKLANRDP